MQGRIQLRRLILRTRLPFAYEGNEDYGSHDRNQPDNNEHSWMCMLRNEGEYLSSITGRQECQKCVPDDSSQSEREQEFSHWILHGARGKQSPANRATHSNCWKYSVYCIEHSQRSWH
jgi:hypothetical protein